MGVVLCQQNGWLGFGDAEESIGSNTNDRSPADSSGNLSSMRDLDRPPRGRGANRNNGPGPTIDYDYPDGGPPPLINGAGIFPGGIGGGDSQPGDSGREQDPLRTINFTPTDQANSRGRDSQQPPSNGQDRSSASTRGGPGTRQQQPGGGNERSGNRLGTFNGNGAGGIGSRNPGFDNSINQFVNLPTNGNDQEDAGSGKSFDNTPDRSNVAPNGNRGTIGQNTNGGQTNNRNPFNPFGPASVNRPNGNDPRLGLQNNPNGQHGITNGNNNNGPGINGNNPRTNIPQTVRSATSLLPNTGTGSFNTGPGGVPFITGGNPNTGGTSLDGLGSRLGGTAPGGATRNTNVGNGDLTAVGSNPVSRGGAFNGGSGSQFNAHGGNLNNGPGSNPSTAPGTLNRQTGTANTAANAGTNFNTGASNIPGGAGSSFNNGNNNIPTNNGGSFNTATSNFNLGTGNVPTNVGNNFNTGTRNIPTSVGNNFNAGSSNVPTVAGSHFNTGTANRPTNSGTNFNTRTINNPSNSGSNVNTGSGNIPTNSGTNFNTGTRNSPSNGGGNFNAGTGNIPTNSGSNFNSGTSNSPTNSASNFNVGTSSIPSNTGGNFNQGTGNLPTTDGNSFNTGASNFATNTGNNFNTGTNNFQTNSGNNNRGTSNIPGNTAGNFNTGAVNFPTNTEGNFNSRTSNFPNNSGGNFNTGTANFPSSTDGNINNPGTNTGNVPNAPSSAVPGNSAVNSAGNLNLGRNPSVGNINGGSLNGEAGGLRGTSSSNGPGGNRNKGPEDFADLLATIFHGRPRAPSNNGGSNIPNGGFTSGRSGIQNIPGGIPQSTGSGSGGSRVGGGGGRINSQNENFNTGSSRGGLPAVGTDNRGLGNSGVNSNIGLATADQPSASGATGFTAVGSNVNTPQGFVNTAQHGGGVNIPSDVHGSIRGSSIRNTQTNNFGEGGTLNPNIQGTRLHNQSPGRGNIRNLGDGNRRLQQTNNRNVQRVSQTAANNPRTISSRKIDLDDQGLGSQIRNQAGQQSGNTVNKITDGSDAETPVIQNTEQPQELPQNTQANTDNVRTLGDGNSRNLHTNTQNIQSNPQTAAGIQQTNSNSATRSPVRQQVARKTFIGDEETSSTIQNTGQNNVKQISRPPSERTVLPLANESILSQLQIGDHGDETMPFFRFIGPDEGTRNPSSTSGTGGQGNNWNAGSHTRGTNRPGRIGATSRPRSRAGTATNDDHTDSKNTGVTTQATSTDDNSSGMTVVPPGDGGVTPLKVMRGFSVQRGEVVAMKTIKSDESDIAILRPDHDVIFHITPSAPDAGVSLVRSPTQKAPELPTTRRKPTRRPGFRRRAGTRRPTATRRSDVVRRWEHMDQEGTLSRGLVRKDGSFAFTNCRPFDFCDLEQAAGS